MAVKRNMGSHFSTYEVPNSDYKVIDVNLKRAVLDYVEEFNKYLYKSDKELPSALILDLSRTIFIDSSFLGSIIVLLKRLNNEKGSLALIVDSEKIPYFLPIRSIGKILAIYPSVDDAIAGVNRFS